MCVCVVKWLDRIGSFVDTAGVDLAPQCWLCLFHLHSSYAQKGQNSRGWQAEGQRRDKRLSFIASVHFSWFSKQSQCLQEVNNFRLSGFVHFLFLFYVFFGLNVNLSFALFPKQIILYSGDRAYEDYDTPVKGRVHFNSPDPKNGDASINVLTVKSTDTGTYQCKVKKAPGVRNKKMQLLVMGM